MLGLDRGFDLSGGGVEGGPLILTAWPGEEAFFAAMAKARGAVRSVAKRAAKKPAAKKSR